MSLLNEDIQKCTFSFMFLSGVMFKYKEQSDICYVFDPSSDFKYSTC